MTRIFDEHRQIWRDNRRRMEARLAQAKVRSALDGERAMPLRLFERLAGAAHLAVRLTGLYGRGLGNALDVRVRQVEFAFPHLPPAFDGYTLLHLSDLHVDCVPGLNTVLPGILSRIRADLVVITGDFQSYGLPAAAETGRHLAPLAAALSPADGILAVLGNHDEAALVEVLEGMGIKVLLNEGVTLTRRGEHLHIVGTDDVHAFYSPAAEAALAARADGFRIALVHTVDLVEPAERLGYALYLSGHTHGGQICLPGGRPLLTALDRHRALAKGAWRHGRLHGYTSSGTGTGTPPVRFNAPPEVAVITLRRGEGGVRLA